MADADEAPPQKRPRMQRRKSSVLLAHERAGLTASVVNHNPPARDESQRPAAVAAAARSMFVAHDTDGNGVLDYGEFRRLLLSFGKDQERLHPNYIEHFLQVADRDKDGQITIEEFAHVFEELQSFDRLLRAPRRRVLQPNQHPADLSKLKDDASMLCPPVECVDLEEEEEAEAAAADDDAPSRRFRVDAHFVSLRRLGEGGYGVLCSATDSRPGGGPVAIKRIAPTDDRLQLRCCLRELAVRRHTPNVRPVHVHPPVHPHAHGTCIARAHRCCATLAPTPTPTCSGSGRCCGRPAARSRRGATSTW